MSVATAACAWVVWAGLVRPGPDGFVVRVPLGWSRGSLTHAYMVPPVSEPTEVSPPSMQQRFFSSAEVPPRMMRGRFPPETQSDWSASH
eukprot:6186822-Prymnesium_polylepis.1